MKMLTNFKFIFTPRNILNIKEEIKKKHKNINEKYKNLIVDDRNLIELLKIIDKLNKDELVNFSYKLKKKDLYLLAKYMPKNQYNIDLEKIYIILKTRFKDEFIKILFEEFKNHYYNYEFNRYFIHFLNLSKKSHRLLNIKSNTLKVLKKWLKEKEIIPIIVKSCFKINKDFNTFMSIFRFEKSTQIYKDCRKYFFTVCTKEDYLTGNTDEILKIFKTYNLDEKVAFINNYLTILEVEEFQESILNYIYYSYGRPEDNQFNWEKVNDKAIEKYKLWIAQKCMKEFFGDDDRYVFWYSYVKNSEAKLLDVNERQLFLDFGELIVVEFRNIGNAAYIYEKGDFYKYFKKYLNNNKIYDDGTYKNRGINLVRIIHSGNWQYKADSILRGVADYV